MKIGITELIVIFIVALFVIGPDKLPAYARKLGEALAQFRKYSQEATKDIRESIVEPLEEAQRPLKEAIEPLDAIDKEIRGNVKEVRDSFAGIGKTKKGTGNPDSSKTLTQTAEGNAPVVKEAVLENDLEKDGGAENAHEMNQKEELV